MPLPRMRVGDIAVEGVCDGFLKTSLDLVIGMDRELSERLVGGTEDGSLYIPVNNFVVRRGDQVILIDAGAGNTMQPTLGRLPGNLAQAGIEPAAVTHILLTHIHPDHANGLVDDAGQPHYPNAEILIHEAEADFWLGPPAGQEPEKIARNRARAGVNLAPYRERLRRLHEGEEALGFRPTLAPGHTPGHTCWIFGTGRHLAMAWGDLVHLSAIQIAHPDTALAYDMDKDLARASRRRVLDMAAQERIAIAGAHVAAPGLGYVVRNGTGYAFEPARE